jgi:hypothetical protein
MNTSAIIMMVIAMGVVIFFTAYFFIKVLRTTPHPGVKEHIPEVKSYDAT